MSDEFDIRLKAQLRALADAVPTATVAAVRPPAPGRLGHGRPMTRTALPIGSLAAVALIVLTAVVIAPRLGFNGAAPTPTADPGHFSPTGSMTTGRAYATATVLQDGRVLIAGGVDGTAYLASAELYDPATGRFSVTGSMTEGRSGHTATLLRDGRVLILGGGASVWHDASAELYDPATGTFSSAGSMTASRSSFTSTLLKDGRVLVSGGMGANGLPTTSAELYDPSTGEFSQTGSMAGARLDHSATLLADGRVLIAGGDVTTPESVTAELYDPATGQFHATGSMARQGFEPTLLTDGRVLFIEGSDEVGLSGARAELYDPASGTFAETGSMTTGRYSARAIRLADGRVLVAGGGFQDLTPPRTNMVNELLSSAELFDRASGRFVPTGSMSTVRVGFMAVLLMDGRVLVAGGDDTLPGQLSASLASAELYTPSKPATVPQPSATATAAAIATPAATATAAAVTVLSPKVVASFGSDDLTATVLGPDGAAYVLDGTTKTVYRVDLQTGAKLPVVASGQGVPGGTVGTPRLLATGGSDVLVLDNSNSLWRWRPALGDPTGRGVLGMVSVPDSVNWAPAFAP